MFFCFSAKPFVNYFVPNYAYFTTLFFLFFFGVKLLQDSFQMPFSQPHYEEKNMPGSRHIQTLGSWRSPKHSRILEICLSVLSDLQPQIWLFPSCGWLPQVLSSLWFFCCGVVLSPCVSLHCKNRSCCSCVFCLPKVSTLALLFSSLCVCIATFFDVPLSLFFASPPPFLVHLLKKMGVLLQICFFPSGLNESLSLPVSLNDLFTFLLCLFCLWVSSSRFLTRRCV